MKHDYQTVYNHIIDRGMFTDNSAVSQTIRAALRLAAKVTGKPSQGFPSMEQVGAAKMWDECKDGFFGHGQAREVFKAMIEQAQREIE